MSQQTVQNNPDLSELLLFQDNFVSLVHAKIYHHLSLEDVILKFEIHHISEANARITQMIHTLTQQLINRKIPYELGVRDCFQRLLQADFLPLLRINRYELTKVSLFGFDIYVQPLEAILQILSRIDAIKKRIIESSVRFREKQCAETALQEGWDYYLAFADQWKMSFNCYMLQEYLRIGGKSFLKKDREIIFTGISNLYGELVPHLASKGNIVMLKELAELNNSLYNFHPSFNFFQLYTMLLPLQDEFEPIFFTINEILQKCLRTNILTPLLFGLLRHREDFLSFIAQADSPIWLPYLNTLISGIAINFKFRILEYEEIIELFEKAVGKAGLLGKIRTDEIVGTLEQGWKDAKEFFISAVKVGFNSGEVQTWKVIEFEEIGPRIMAGILDGMLLNVEANTEAESYLGKPQEKLSQLIRKLSDNRLDWNSIQNGVCQLQGPIEKQQQLLTLIRVLNLIKLIKAQNEYNLSFAVDSILSMSCSPSKCTQAKLLSIIGQINGFLCGQETNSLTFLKERVISLHRLFPPQQDLPNIIRFYFDNYQPKRCFSTLMEIVAGSTAGRDILAQYVSKQLIPAQNHKLVKVRTFERELLVKSDIVNAPYENHCVLSVLVAELTKDNPHAEDLIIKIVRANPLVAFSLLNFPINENNRLFSFSTFTIEKNRYHKLLKEILMRCKGAILSQEQVDLIEVLSYPSIREQICKRINEVEDIDQLYIYANFLLWVYRQIGEAESNCRQLLHIYLYVLQKSTSVELIHKTVSDIAGLAVCAFGDKLDQWMSFLLAKKIEGKFDVQRISRKRALKIMGSSIYFVNDIQEGQLAKLKTSAKERTTECDIEPALLKRSSEELVNHFWSTLSRLSKLGLGQINAMNKNDHILFEEQIKSLCIPQLAEVTLKQLIQTDYKQPVQELSHTICLLGLNTENYLRLVEEALFLSHCQYLIANRFIARLNTKMGALLVLSTQNKTNILKEMSVNLSREEQQKIADGFFLQSSLLDAYVQFIEGIEYLVLYNNLNWRVVVDHLSKVMASSNLCSVILQYNEYVTITAHPNSEYETIITKNGSIFGIYVNLVVLKLDRIFGQPCCEEELQLKSVNELTYLNLVMSSLQLKEIITKLGTLHKTMKERSISYDHSWIGDLQKLNQKIHNLFQGDVIPPDFLNGYYFTNEVVLQTHKTEVGLILENYYDAVGDVVPEESFYQPKLGNFQKVSLSELTRGDRSIIDQEKVSQEDLTAEAQKLLKNLKEIQRIVIGEQEEESFKYDDIEEKEGELDAFYVLGCIYALKQFKIPALLVEITKRNRLAWEVLRHVRSDEYHHIKSILVQPQMSRRELFFVKEGEDLIPNGSQIKVIEYNRDIYCQKAGMKAIGAGVWRCLSQFVKGFSNQRAQA